MARSRRRTWGLIIPMGIAAVLMSPGVAYARSPCVAPGQSNYFAGDGIGESPALSNIDGVAADIEWVDPQLCIQGSTIRNSWSLSWVSLDGPDTTAPGISIFQGGIARCPPPTVGSCPHENGNSYYWHFYQREAGPCGPKTGTPFLKARKGNAGPGTLTYRIIRITDPEGGFYSFQIDGEQQASRSVTDLGNCSDGPIAVHSRLRTPTLGRSLGSKAYCTHSRRSSW